MSEPGSGELVLAEPAHAATPCGSLAGAPVVQAALARIRTRAVQGQGRVITEAVYEGRPPTNLAGGRQGQHTVAFGLIKQSALALSGKTLDQALFHLWQLAMQTLPDELGRGRFSVQRLFALFEEVRGLIGANAEVVDIVQGLEDAVELYLHLANKRIDTAVDPTVSFGGEEKPALRGLRELGAAVANRETTDEDFETFADRVALLIDFVPRYDIRVPQNDAELRVLVGVLIRAIDHALFLVSDGDLDARYLELPRLVVARYAQRIARELNLPRERWEWIVAEVKAGLMPTYSDTYDHVDQDEDADE